MPREMVNGSNFIQSIIVVYTAVAIIDFINENPTSFQSYSLLGSNHAGFMSSLEMEGRKYNLGTVSISFAATLAASVQSSAALVGC